ncbi:gas vesicle protein GvpG [Staphylococcus chromogenes]|uniref:gas vesicle protein GvpG n=1 Tax=Staphylococcus chromogenes TaxID=46126 RepID=UPI000D1B289D|nr:gas vesicle protein GvpG [Staphylococcus chromogenes]PTG20831.1 gas vesicle protein GvpG [Staphylococcus chromogenes]QDW90517.1 gas vesicle protein GvpG [Staphylococcus chromogenes]QDW99809.1 gas vesicle protein GvpG [Staphylococcus chromogenes]QIN25530.1 gas vesicle protein GvpG [Staphylococcus chromogenes]TJY15208.1 gas vesicle protein GvpG [Staphylococcus chromogenes]
MLAYGSIKMLTSIARKVKEEADKELYDLPTIEKKLIHLQMMAELGEIPEDVYKEQEEVLLTRYEIAKQREIDKWEAFIEEKEES